MSAKSIKEGYLKRKAIRTKQAARKQASDTRRESLPNKDAFSRDSSTFPAGTSIRPAPINTIPKSVARDKRSIVATAGMAKDDLASKKKFLGNTEASLMQQQLANAQSQLQTIQSKVNSNKVAQDRKMQEDDLALRNKEIDAKSKLTQGAFGSSGSETKIPVGWDAETYANFKKANPNLEPDEEDTALMQGEDPTLSAYDKRINDAAVRLADIDAQLEKSSAKLKTETDKILKGTFPLNAYERTMVDSLQSNIAELKEQQLLANKNYEGGVTQAGIMQGLDRYSPVLQQGRIFSTVSQGIAKIKNIEVTGAQALAELKQGFADKAYEKITSSYEKVESALNSKREAIQKLHDDIQKEKDDLVAANAAASEAFTTFTDDLAKTAAMNDAPPEVLTNIQNSPDKIAAYRAAQGYLSNATGEVGNYNFYTKQERAAGRTPMSFFDYQHYKSPESSGGVFSSGQKELFELEGKYGEDYMKRDEVKRFSVTDDAYSTAKSIIGDKDISTMTAKDITDLGLQGSDARTLALQLARANNPDSARAADDGDIQAADSLEQIANQTTNNLLKGDKIVPEKFLGSLKTLERTYNSRLSAKGRVDQEFNDRAKRYGIGVSLPKVGNMQGLSGDETIAESKVNNYVSSNPEKADMVANLFSKPSPAFDNKPPTNLQVYEYLKAKGLVK